MDPRPKNYEKTDTDFAIGIYNDLDSLFAARTIPDLSRTDQRYSELELTGDETAALEPIFNGNTLDAPDKVKIILVGSRPKDLKPGLEGFALIIVESENVGVGYIIWLQAGNPTQVNMSKEGFRKHDIIAKPNWQKMPFPELDSEHIFDDEPIHDYEQKALQEMIESLS